MEIFGKNLALLREQQGLNQKELAETLGVTRVTISDYERNRSEPKLYVLTKISDYFKVSVDSILRDVHLIENLKNKKNAENVHLNVHPSVHPNKTFELTRDRKSEPNHNRMPHVITVDTRGDENIMFVPIKAQAGYLSGYGDPEFIESLPAYRLPGMDNGSFRMFEIKGQSMVPTLHESDIVVTRFVDNLNAIRNDRVHVVVTKDDGICAKRVFNNIASDGKLILNSENQARPGEFPPIVLNPEDVLEIWYVVANMTRQLRRAGDMYNKMVNIEARLILLEDERRKRLENA